MSVCVSCAANSFSLCFKSLRTSSCCIQRNTCAKLTFTRNHAREISVLPLSARLELFSYQTRRFTCGARSQPCVPGYPSILATVLSAIIIIVNVVITVLLNVATRCHQKKKACVRHPNRYYRFFHFFVVVFTVFVLVSSRVSYSAFVAVFAPCSQLRD